MKIIIVFKTYTHIYTKQNTKTMDIENNINNESNNDNYTKNKEYL